MGSRSWRYLAEGIHGLPECCATLSTLSEGVSLHNPSRFHAARLIGLVLGLRPAHLPLVGEEQEPPQGVQRLPLVQLDADPASVCLAAEVPQDEQRPGHPTVFLQGSGQGVATRVRLELADQQHGGHVTPLQHAGHP
jgi:hypothetical protein